MIVIRGDDGQVRAFANVCRHRGSRLVDGEAGCAKVLTCPYHAWSYARDGRLVGVPHRKEYPGLDTAAHRLFPLDLELWRGFWFVTLEPGAPPVAEMMAPYEHEIAPYRFEEMRAIGRLTLRPRELNWKTIADNYSDGLHIPVGHPGLTRLFGRSYAIEANEHVDRMEGELRDDPSDNPSRARLSEISARGRAFAADRTARNGFITSCSPTSPSTFIPTRSISCSSCRSSATETVIREVSYALPDERREMKAARYLNWRINRRVNAEDSELITRVQLGMASAELRRRAAGDERSVPALVRARSCARWSPKRGSNPRRGSNRASLAARPVRRRAVRATGEVEALQTGILACVDRTSGPCPCTGRRSRWSTRTCAELGAGSRAGGKLDGRSEQDRCVCSTGSPAVMPIRTMTAEDRARSRCHDRRSAP